MDTFPRDMCTAAAWQSTFSSLLYHLRDALTTTPHFSEKNCQIAARKTFTTEALFMICVILIFLTLTLIGSFISVWESIDESSRRKISSLYARKKDRNATTEAESDEKSTETPIYTVFFRSLKKFLDCFCILKNAKIILDTTTKNQFDVINGIRTITFLWMFIAHAVIYYINAVRYPDDDFENMIKSPLAQLIIDGKLPTDIMFVLWGFLNAVSFCKDYTKKNGKVPLLSFYIHRFLRYLPTYMIVLGFYATLMSYTGSGRLWPNYDTNPVCKRTFGWNIIHLNNFQNQYEQCYKPSWFYASAMQLHIISPLVLILLMKWPIVGYACVCCCILSSWLLHFGLTVKFNLIEGFSAIAFNLSDLKTFYGRFNQYMDIIWDKPYTRLSSFLVGIAYGCYFHRKKFTKGGKSSRLSLYYGLIAFAISTWISSIQIDEEKSSLETAVHNIVSSFLFCICSSWIIYTCSSGLGGWLNEFLSYKYFAPIARLSFSCHLINLIVIERYFLSLEQPIEYSAVSLVLLIMYLLFWTFSASFIVAAVFEIPVSRIIGLFSRKLKE